MASDRRPGDTLLWDCKPFSELAPSELYEALRLRVDVFVVEQTCAYPEIDGRDPESWHLFGRRDGKLVAYARWYPENGAVRLGRIVLDPSVRGGRTGGELMEQALRRIGPAEVVIGAQQPLESFYRRFGFRTVHGPYDDYGIPHLDMVRGASDEMTAAAGLGSASAMD